MGGGSAPISSSWASRCATIALRPAVVKTDAVRQLADMGQRDPRVDAYIDGSAGFWKGALVVPGAGPGAAALK